MKTKSKSLSGFIFYAGVLALSFSIALVMKFSQTGKAIVPETLLNSGILFLMITLISFLARYFLKKAEELTPIQRRKRMIPGFLVFLITTVLIANFSISLGIFVWFLIKGISLQYLYQQLITRELGFANKSLLVSLVALSIVFFILLWGKASRNEIKLLEENFQYKYRLLKSQVNPHFLFNSLNTLSELIYSDVKKADLYIQKLSGIYRYILDNEDTDLVNLEKEITFIEDYFALQKVRDDQKISLQIALPDIGGYKIVPVSLQVLIENALKHNSRSVEKPLMVSISMDKDFVVVSNNIQRKSTLENSTQKGLANLNERVKLICGRSLVISEESESFTVRIPIIKG